MLLHRGSHTGKALKVIDEHFIIFSLNLALRLVRKNKCEKCWPQEPIYRLCIILLPGGAEASSPPQCYKCSYTRLETSNTALDFLLDIVDKLSDDSCKLAKSRDLDEVHTRSCPQPPEGLVSKCVSVMGEVSTTVRKGPLGKAHFGHCKR